MTATTAQAIPCRITLRRTSGGVTYFGITSPKTGKRLEVAREYLADLPRLAGRIVKAIGRDLTASFTVADLRAFHAAYVRQSQPRPLRYWGMRRRIVRRPAWR